MGGTRPWFGSGPYFLPEKCSFLARNQLHGSVLPNPRTWVGRVRGRGDGGGTFTVFAYVFRILVIGPYNSMVAFSLCLTICKDQGTGLQGR